MQPDSIVLYWAFLFQQYQQFYFRYYQGEAASETFDSFKKTIRDGVNIILIITIPATVGMIVLAEPIVKVVFERGAFDAVATQMTSQALIFYTLGLVGNGSENFLGKRYFIH